jgi:two-component system nitrogen regulation sensor histidine kinase NtrY
MFIASASFMQTSVDYWFKNQVETSMTQALSVGQMFLVDASQRVQSNAIRIKEIINTRKWTWNSPGTRHLLETQVKDSGFALSGIISPDQKPLVWHDRGEATAAWNEVAPRLAGNIPLSQEAGVRTIFQPGIDGDYAFGILPLDGDNSNSLILAVHMSEGTMFKLDQVVRGLDEYKQLRTLKRPFKATFYFFLVLLALIIVFGSMWFGFKLAKQMSEPLLTLAMGTERIAKGDLSIRFADTGDDEVGQLIRSFNRMTEDLAAGQAEITAVNRELALSNTALAEHSQYIETVLDSVASVVISLDAKDQISTANKAVHTLFDKNPAEIIGKSPLEVIGPEYSGVLKLMLAQLRANPKVKWQEQISISRKDREWKFLVTVAGLSDAQGVYQGLVAVLEDITEMEKMQRVAAWREVARRIAHEIKNPLTPIKLSAQRLQRKFGAKADDSSFKECTSLIVNQVEHLQQMVEEFSAFAKLPEVKLKTDELRPVLEEQVNLFRTSHSRIAWELDCPDNLPPIAMDAAALSRALMNILTNAEEALAGQKNGKVIVRADYNHAEHTINIAIADNGPGLPDEELFRVFEPYFSRKKGGTGLGLTIVKSIITDHRGYVRANPEPGGGTVFNIQLPVL